MAHSTSSPGRLSNEEIETSRRAAFKGSVRLDGRRVRGVPREGRGPGEAAARHAVSPIQGKGRACSIGTERITSVATTFERARRFSQLAQECDQLALIQIDPALKEHYQTIAIHYFTLAEAELRLAQQRQERIRKHKKLPEFFADRLGKLPPRKPAAPSKRHIAIGTGTR